MLDQLNPEAIVVENLAHIQKSATVAARQFGLHGDDAEDFASWVKIRLMEDDYAVIRKFRGESGIRTYLTTVILRMLFAYSRELRGRWRPSAAAERLGPPADELERLVHRDGYSLPQASEKLRTEGRTALTDRELAELFAQLPHRQPLRPTEISSESLLDDAEGASRADERVTAAEARAERRNLLARIGRALAQLTPEDQAIVRLHFQENLSVADVARALNLEQKPLYRRIPRLRERLRELLKREGISEAAVRALLQQENS